MAERVDSLPSLPPRPDEAHKGTFGRTLLVGGSVGMAGSIALAGEATLRSGGGLVTLAVPEAVQPTVAGFFPAYMTRGWTMTGASSQSLAAGWRAMADTADAVAIGPGLGRAVALQQAVASFVATLAKPLVVDADALFSLRVRESAEPAGPRVFTPHVGEFARLTEQDVDAIEADRVGQAERAATKLRGVVVLKGPGTVVTDGRRTAVNETGNSGLATGGTGDVLTGIITALLGQGVDAWDAARLGVHVHGLAGDFAAMSFGPRAMTAPDVLDSLSDAWRQMGE